MNDTDIRVMLVLLMAMTAAYFIGYRAGIDDTERYFNAVERQRRAAPHVESNDAAFEAVMGESC